MSYCRRISSQILLNRFTSKLVLGTTVCLTIRPHACSSLPIRTHLACYRKFCLKYIFFKYEYFTVCSVFTTLPGSAEEYVFGSPPFQSVILKSSWPQIIKIRLTTQLTNNHAQIHHTAVLYNI